MQIKRGLKIDLPDLKDGELGLCLDTNELYIGNDGNKNILLSDKLVNNLTTGGAYNILSAEQGKILKEQLDEKANASDLTNGLNYKGSCLYASLPTTGMVTGDFWYCSDGATDTGAGYYAYNGTNWYFCGEQQDLTLLENAITELTYLEDNTEKSISNETEIEDSSHNGFYKYNDGSFYDTTTYVHKKCACQYGDVFSVTSTWGANANIVNFYSGEPSSTTYLGKFKINSATDVSSTNQKIIAPKNAEYAIFNCRINVDFVVEKRNFYKAAAVNDFNAVQNQINLLFSSFAGYRAPEVTLNTGKLFDITTNAEVTLNVGTYFEYELQNISTVRINGKAFTSSKYPMYTFYDNSNNKLLSSVYSDPGTYINEIIAVPENSAKVIIQYDNRNDFYFEIQSSAYQVKTPIYYLLNDNKLYVSTKYGSSKDLVVLIKKKGGNNLIDFGYFYTIPNTDKFPVPISTSFLNLLYGTDSDYHGPMIVRAVNNQNGDNITDVRWSGGNHQYNNTGVGSTATARCENIKFAIDNYALTSGEGYCNFIKVEWDNYVQSYTTEKADGTGREVLKEHHRLEFDGQTWNSFVEITALEDIIFERYYGFQYGGIGSLYPKVKYLNATNRLECDATANNTESGDKTCSMIRGYGTEHEILMFLDTNFDLGKREHYTGTQGGLTQTYGKAYFYTIHDQQTDSAEYLVSQGQTIAMKGGWIFKPL